MAQRRQQARFLQATTGIAFLKIGAVSTPASARHIQHRKRPARQSLPPHLFQPLKQVFVNRDRLLQLPSCNKVKNNHQRTRAAAAAPWSALKNLSMPARPPTCANGTCALIACLQDLNSHISLVPGGDIDLQKCACIVSYSNAFVTRPGPVLQQPFLHHSCSQVVP